jgi:hypothetical protein
MALPKRLAHLGPVGRPGLVDSGPVVEAGIVLEDLLVAPVLEVASVPEALVSGRVGDMGRVAGSVPSVLNILKP